MATKRLRIRCGFCNKKISKNRPWQKFCSTKCRMDFQKSGTLPGVAIERLVKKFVLRWTDAIIDREMKKAKAKILEQIRTEFSPSSRPDNWTPVFQVSQPESPTDPIATVLNPDSVADTALHEYLEREGKKMTDTTLNIIQEKKNSQLKRAGACGVTRLKRT
jgi:hypothetical protein